MSRKPITINPGIHNSRQNISLAIKAKRGHRYNKLIGCTVDDFRWHLERQFTTGMTWDNYGDWCVDHTVQCCSFPVEDPGAKYRCHHWGNLCPAWLTDVQSRKDSEQYIMIPDYETLRHVTPRETFISEYGIPDLIQNQAAEQHPNSGQPPSNNITPRKTGHAGHDGHAQISNPFD